MKKKEKKIVLGKWKRRAHVRNLSSCSIPHYSLDTAVDPGPTDQTKSACSLWSLVSVNRSYSGYTCHLFYMVGQGPSRHWNRYRPYRNTTTCSNTATYRPIVSPTCLWLGLRANYRLQRRESRYDHIRIWFYDFNTDNMSSIRSPGL